MEPTRRHLARYDARQLRAHGVLAIAGVDEVGRGCLAGPVVAAAVILPAKTKLPGVDDSKKLTREQRETQALAVRAVAIAIGVSFVGPRVIETINIRGASLLAMRRAVHRARVRLRRTPEAAHGGSLLVLVDGLDVIPGVELTQHAVVSGDGTSLAIAAASIVAKTVHPKIHGGILARRDVPAHLEALDRHGPCRWHRYSFSPIAQTELFALHALEDALP